MKRKSADLLWLENLELNRYTGGKAMTETMWRCDQVRAGQLYNRMMFDTREEAEQFARQHAADGARPDVCDRGD